MSLALLDRAQQRLPDVEEWAEGRGVDAAGDGVALHPGFGTWVRGRGNCTLDQLITDRWRLLAGGESVRCPVCDGQMESCDGQAAAVHGRCLDCGATLS